MTKVKVEKLGHKRTEIEQPDSSIYSLRWTLSISNIHIKIGRNSYQYMYTQYARLPSCNSSKV